MGAQIDRSKRRGLKRSKNLAISVGFILGIVLFMHSAMADTPRLEVIEAQIAEQQRELRAQQAELEELKAAAEAMRDQQAELAEIQSIADDVREAAAKHTAIHAGYSSANGFYIGSDDGMFKLRIAGLIMGRHVLNLRDTDTQDSAVGGFELARTRFGFIGHIHDPSWKFVIWTGHNDSGGALLLDANIKKVFDNGWSITAGQFKLPLWREWLVSEKTLPLAERSLLNTLSGSYTQGVLLTYTGEKLRLNASLGDGAGNLNVPWQVEDTEFGVAVRAEYLIDGCWSQFKSYECWDNDQTGIMLGGALAYDLDEQGTANPNVNTFRWTSDLSWECSGYNVSAAVIGVHDRGDAKRDRIGVLLQAGAFVTDDVEVVGRYEWLDVDLAGNPDVSIATVGVNYFIHGHALRLSTEVSYAFNEIGAGVANAFAGYLADDAGEDGQVVVRTQVQLAF